MSESESEDEILDRIEAALRKIAGASAAPHPAASAAGDVLDRESLSEKLDDIIGKLRDGLGGMPPRAVETSSAPAEASPETAAAPVPEDAPPAEDDAPPEIWPEPGE